ncbi:non-ribosomal peptide synthetase-like protein [Actinomycetospora succinea]|uniref:Non-ribosomal peptide synthetase-like protein n=1 Tax=Actinomycetospora succinea TaxID=663603 RepID=A0A4R6VLQ4_9PSEU|nr:Pls/PosA family non-ribosomal peptide synthetase [Actinomycetospora succinea]TDQ62895.1 non-ribosomal peptide synthetase-like protein [Actinomycetospora succinea]
MTGVLPTTGTAVTDGSAAPVTRLEQFFERTADRTPDAVAVEHGDHRRTYAELDRDANRLAHLIAEHGVGTGSRVAILLERSVATYVALLAVGKTGAAFVPIDPGSPADRVEYVVTDAGADLVLTTEDLAGGLTAPALVLDAAETAARAALVPDDRPARDADPEQPAYVIYTSGSSGRPKGVEVAQSSIVNFVDVVTGVYDVHADDRVLQGMTISFDFSIEEIWPTWAAGATLVAAPTGAGRVGGDLADFLDERGVTVLYAVPTLLATIPRDLPAVRTLLVGGEACPAELVERWARPGRRMLNTYGPTEATVTATVTELSPGEPVTIGTPLPTYTAELTDPEDPDHHPVPDGAVGEVTLGGPGVARGYVGMPEKTAEKFVAHPVTGERVYRTGDLGRIDEHGEIVYLGRADAEVKVRGHRVDLGEIESVLLADDGIAAAAVDLHAASGDLAAYVVTHGPGDEAALAERLGPALRDVLPGYMVPATLDVLAELPTQPSGKVDRPGLPDPRGCRLVSADGPVVRPDGPAEERVAEVVATTLGLDEVSVTADFFDELGGHSLAAARVVSALREAGVPVAVRDLYAHPTVRGLAGLTGGAEAPAAEEPLRHPTRRVAAAGTVQALLIAVLLLVVAAPLAVAWSRWTGALTPGYIAGVVGAAVGSWVLVRGVLPLAARPLAAGIGAGRYPLWGLTHLRLWAAEGLVRLSPLEALAGSPLAGPYLRLLGARVGRDVHLASADVGLPRLLTLGDEAAIGYGAHLHPWHVTGGRVVVAPIVVGDRAAVGTAAVLEAGATLGADGYLGEQSVLAAGEDVAKGASRAGSPAQAEDAPGHVDELRTAPALPGWRARHHAAAVAGFVGLEVATLLPAVPTLALVLAGYAVGGIGLALVAAVVAGPVFVLATCAVVAVGRRAVLPRTPAGVHPLRSGFGLRKWIADRLFARSLATTNTLYATLYTPAWLRVLGAEVGRRSEVSTVSNLDPDLLEIGEEAFVADMATVGSATVVRGRIRLRPTRVGDRAFVGNAAVAPAGTQTGAGSLVGVHTVPPADVPADSSWLGSPAIHLPRREDSGDHDASLTFRPSRGRVAGRLAIELVRAVLPATVLGAAATAGTYVLFLLATTLGVLPAVLLAPLVLAGSALAVVLAVVALKWLVVGRYRPRTEPLWDLFVRRTEFVTGVWEGAAVPVAAGALVSTPMLPWVLRLLGASLGRRTWVGTTHLTEFDLVHVGDDAAVGRGVSLQTHLFEDRVMKMSHVRIGHGATVGDRSVVLYDAAVGDGTELGGLSLVMKGERLADGTRWRGVPAQV